MLKSSFTIILAIVLLSCGGGSQQAPASEIELTDLEKIAQAHGIDNFSKKSFLQYTFNVQRDTSISSRTWNWFPPTDEVIAINKGDSIRYNQSDINEDLKSTDHRFINDKYWLLFPYQLIWDDAIVATNHGIEQAPISGSELTKITIQYGNAGGYTPGDAYDIYVDDNWVIREWAFRRSGQDEPNLITTWQDYIEIDGMLIATNHLNKDGSFRLFFSDLRIE